MKKRKRRPTSTADPSAQNEAPEVNRTVVPNVTEERNIDTSHLPNVDSDSDDIIEKDGAMPNATSVRQRKQTTKESEPSANIAPF